MIWLTSDTHFSHKNILSYEPNSRPFASIEEMNETLINNWNSVIDENDDVWVCGDFFMGPITSIEPILNRLKGKIHLVRGNHDQKNRMKIYEAHGIDIHDIAYIQYKKKLFLCTHYPMIVENGDCDKHIFNLHGHTHQHSLFSEYPRCIHVGVDSNNLTPISIEKIYSITDNYDHTT